jgi:hypothetical protein
VMEFAFSEPDCRVESAAQACYLSRMGFRNQKAEGNREVGPRELMMWLVQER